MRTQEIELRGRRCIRVTAYLYEVPGEDPEPRILLASAWKDDPPVPVSDRCISLPASDLPKLLEALRGLEGQT